MKKPIPVLIPLLVFVTALFIGILIFTYVETKRANPQMIRTATTRQLPSAPAQFL